MWRPYHSAHSCTPNRDNNVYEAQHAFRFISCRIVLISVQDDGDGCESTLKDELPQPRGSLANNIPSHGIQSKPIKSFDKMIAIHNTLQMHSNFSIFKFRVLFNFIY